MFRRLTAVAALLLPLVISSTGMSAQGSRTATLEQQRAEKAAQLQPYRPGRLERALLYVEKEDPLRKIAPRNGFFVEYGYTDKPVGSGLAASAGFRHDLFDRRARVVLETGGSLRGYRLLRADISQPSLANGRVEIGVGWSDRHNPQEDFYGLGPLSVAGDRVNFLLDRRDLQGRVVVKPLREVQAGVRFGRMSPSIGAGTDRRFPSIEQRFNDRDAPGLAAQPNFAYGDLFAIVDGRDQPGNPRAGGYYGITWRRYSDLDFHRYGFHALDADVHHFFPIFDKKRVIAVRGRVWTTSAAAGAIVPFYLRPTLGGSDSLRSVRDFQFRDNNAMSMNVEYRWEAFSGLDMALFTDWGKVTPRAGDLDFTDLERAYGIGFRFNTFKSVFLRLDVALAGAEAPRYFLKFSRAF